MDIDRRIAAARRRIHEHIDARLWFFEAHMAAQRAENAEWVRERARFYRRSIGQLNRYHRRRVS